MRFLRVKISEAVRCLFKHESPLLIISMCVLFGVRLWLGRKLGCSFDPTLYNDDMLLINYADLYGHFVAHNLPLQDSLAKVMGYPLILWFVKVSGLVYADVISTFWFGAACVQVMLIRVLRGEKNFPLDLAIFAFALFTPIAFDFNTGPKLYRNAVLPPLYFVVLAMMTILSAWHFLKAQINPRRVLAFNVIFGLIFTLTYYVKEDGIWLLYCLVAVMMICFVKIITDGKKIIPCVILLLVPLIIFAGGTVAYKAVNKIFFGVYLINNRTEGELGRFQRLIYKIKSDERTATIWTPTDALAKAFDTSETLRGTPALREEIFHTNWFGGDIEKNPITGEFLSWVMLTELYESGACENLSEQEKFLGKVNDELEAAFDAGALEEDDRFQLLSSMGGMTLEEIFSLGELVLIEYETHVTLNYYLPGVVPFDFAPYAKKFGVLRDSEDYDAEKFIIRQATEPKDALDKAAAITHMNFSEADARADDTNRLIEKIFSAYSVIQCVLFVAAVIGVIGGLRAVIRRKKIFSVNDYLMLAVACGLMLLSGCYAFAVAWFCEFVRGSGNPVWFLFLKYYSTALVPMLMTFEILGACLFCRLCKKIFEGSV